MTYDYSIIHPLDLDAQKDDLGFTINPKNHPHCISKFSVHRMDYLSFGFAKLKYSDAFTPTLGGVNPILTHVLTKQYLTASNNLPSLN